MQEEILAVSPLVVRTRNAKQLPPRHCSDLFYVVDLLE